MNLTILEYSDSHSVTTTHSTQTLKHSNVSGIRRKLYESIAHYVNNSNEVKIFLDDRKLLAANVRCLVDGYDDNVSDDIIYDEVIAALSGTGTPQQVQVPSHRDEDASALTASHQSSTNGVGENASPTSASSLMTGSVGTFSHTTGVTQGSTGGNR